MRLVLIPLLASLAVAAPAMAESTPDSSKTTGARFDVHGGLGWADGQTAQGTLGATLGYDVATPGHTFVGIEQSVDKVLTSSDKARWSTTARAGLQVTPANKLYGLAGYSYGVGPNGTHIGGGVEHAFGPYFTKVEYRHTFNEDAARDSNAALVGVGLRF
jgi:hypothetical protein